MIRYGDIHIRILLYVYYAVIYKTIYFYALTLITLRTHASLRGAIQF